MGVFDGLSERLSAAFRKWTGAGKLNAAHVEEGLREIRIALLEADVNLRVANDFLDRVREKATGTHILASLDPVQMLVKIVRDEIVELLGGKDVLPPDTIGKGLTPILMLGLQGSGKTTTAAKLALHFKKKGVRTMLAALDMSRPAAIDQLEILGREIDVPVYADRAANPVDAAKAAVEQAKRENVRVLIMDSAGRLHIDDELMEEVRRIKLATDPVETYLVVDAMTGQEAVNVAETFDRIVGITGLCVTKFDGDARSGAALSVKTVTGIPIRWVGTGEKVDMLEAFIPERMASRILGMGDVLSLIEKAEKEIDEEEAERISEGFLKGKFDVSDFIAAMAQMQKLGPMKQILGMLPGMRMTDEMADVGEERLKIVKAVAYSMTNRERRRPETIDASRKRRIAAGSGTSVDDVDQFLASFKQMQEMMKMMGGGKGLMNLMSGGTSKPAGGPLGTLPYGLGGYGGGFAGGASGLGARGGGGFGTGGGGERRSRRQEEKSKVKMAKKARKEQRKKGKKK
jgi:signal recognition particle subunit SRP54